MQTAHASERLIVEMRWGSLYIDMKSAGGAKEEHVSFATGTQVIVPADCSASAMPVYDDDVDAIVEPFGGSGAAAAAAGRGAKGRGRKAS